MRPESVLDIRGVYEKNNCDGNIVYVYALV